MTKEREFGSPKDQLDNKPTQSNSAGDSGEGRSVKPRAANGIDQPDGMLRLNDDRQEHSAEVTSAKSRRCIITIAEAPAVAADTSSCEGVDILSIAERLGGPGIQIIFSIARARSRAYVCSSEICSNHIPAVTLTSDD
jgi:hypothetical protein